MQALFLTHNSSGHGGLITCIELLLLLLGLNYVILPISLVDSVSNLLPHSLISKDDWSL